jgi:hypothetical protein
LEQISDFKRGYASFVLRGFEDPSEARSSGLMMEVIFDAGNRSFLGRLIRDHHLDTDPETRVTGMTRAMIQEKMAEFHIPATDRGRE